ncbi:YczE/YyaS/YitT family protein [Salibacterium aidingense]|uniref:YczE/YyaS/YitT family protein n=1 Tax=Salibacterium aidingense TaxID=384933 RepID=UPI0003FFAE19|nr:YitT family protein [Salibacterium aidingense]
MERSFGRKEHLVKRWLIFMAGIIIMSFGIALMITAELGSAPWDVLHIGLQKQFGLTIGSWSIIAGIVIIGTTAVLQRELPQAGGILNMFLVGVFIDIFLLLLSTPEMFLMKLLMLLCGIVVIGYGIGTYIAPECGAGPRDSLMLALQEKTGWKVSRVRGIMEIGVLLIGWMLGGPVFIGTILFCLGIGQVVGFALPQCKKIVYRLVGRGGKHENINQRTLRPDHYDGTRKEIR